MEKLFIIQLITSFFVGGSIIALLSFVAEKTPAKIAGVILSLPSTVVISFMFIAWTTSPETIGDIMPTTMITGSTVMIFTFVYIKLSQIKLPKIYSMLLSFGGALSAWAICSLPFAIIQFQNLTLALIIYALTISLAYYFLTVRNKQISAPNSRSYTNTQKTGRAIFAGTMITLAVFLSKTVHPFWGGILSGFPVVFTSTFLLAHWYYGADMLLKISKNIPKGSLVYVPYIFVAGWSFPTFGIILGSIVAYIVATASFFIIKKTSTQK